jgi:hypothetical protein
MNRVTVDFSTEILMDGQAPALLRAHRLQIVGSERSDPALHTVRLVLEGEAIPNSVDGRLCAMVVSKGVEGLTASTTIEFQPRLTR